MKKYFVVADVHSFYNELMNVLNNAGFDKENPNHIFINCGDLMDRGPSPLSCLMFVNSLPDDRKILVRGNHEDLIEQCIARKDCLSHDYHNGTAMTIADLSYSFWASDAHMKDMFDEVKRNSEYKKYMSSLVDYAEVGDYIFVHGWIPCDRDDPNPYHARNINYTFNEDWRNGDWDNARWINGMDAWHQGVKIEGKTIVCGHWHSSYGNSKFHKDGMEFPNYRSTNPEHRYANFNPFIDDGIIALDACTAESHQVNCYTFEVEE